MFHLELFKLLIFIPERLCLLPLLMRSVSYPPLPQIFSTHIWLYCPPLQTFLLIFLSSYFFSDHFNYTGSPLFLHPFLSDTFEFLLWIWFSDYLFLSYMATSTLYYQKAFPVLPVSGLAYSYSTLDVAHLKITSFSKQLIGFKSTQDCALLLMSDMLIL